MGNLFDKAKKRIEQLRTFKVKAGVLRGATYPDTGESVAQVAIWQEYGTSTIPPRPFLRTSLNRHGKKWQSSLKKQVVSYAMGNQSLDAVTTKVGEEMIADIKDTIRQGMEPPISEVTLMTRQLVKNEGWNKQDGGTYFEARRRVAKGETAEDVDDTPLYDTHILYKAIDYE